MTLMPTDSGTFPVSTKRHRIFKKKNVFCVTAYNQPYNSPLQICIAGRMHFSKKKNNDMFFSNWNKEPDEEKNYRRTEFFTSWTLTGEKCTRAHVQENKSIYVSIYL